MDEFGRFFVIKTFKVNDAKSYFHIKGWFHKYLLQSIKQTLCTYKRIVPFQPPIYVKRYDSIHIISGHLNICS